MESLGEIREDQTRRSQRSISALKPYASMPLGFYKVFVIYPFVVYFTRWVWRLPHAGSLKPHWVFFRELQFEMNTPMIVNVTHMRNQFQSSHLLLCKVRKMKKEKQKRRSRAVVSMLCFSEIEIIQICTNLNLIWRLHWIKNLCTTYLRILQSCVLYILGFYHHKWQYYY